MENVGPANLACCGIGCLTSPKHQGYQPRVEWLQKRFREGLRIPLFRDGGGRPLAFLEYVPGEYAWRPVQAKSWLFVHCLWVFPREQKVGGLGGRLIRACVEEARQARAIGVAAMVSDGPWMAAREVFLGNGFTQIGETEKLEFNFSAMETPANGRRDYTNCPRSSIADKPCWCWWR